jgi:ComF family protein
MTLTADLLELLHALLPEACPRCGDLSNRGFCAACRADFDRIERPCVRCAEPARHAHCPAQSHDWPLDAIRAPFAFHEPLAGFVKALKYSGCLRLAPPLAELLAESLGELPADTHGIGTPACDWIAAVPLHPVRLRERTFNQAEEIAAVLARRLGLPLKRAGLRRLRNTPPQTELKGGARWHNLGMAFAADGPLDGARAVIVDDVITTGATVNAVARALKTAGAAHVEAWAVARTLQDGASTQAVRKT